MASTSQDQSSPANNGLGQGQLIYKNPGTANPTPLNQSMIAPQGGSLPHNNMMPYLCMNFIIALQGIYPPRS
jgi:microcystin-dependent protein